MAYELKQELRLSQSLVMTPQLQLAIKLLQLSRLELLETIKEEVQTNPVLEETPADTVEGPPEEPASQEVDWQAYLESSADYSGPSVNFSERDPEEQDNLISNLSISSETLQDHLLYQLHMLGLEHDDLELAEFIICNIDSDGYLRMVERGSMTDAEVSDATVAEIARHTGASAERIASMLELIQNLDPTGAGSRSLSECLSVQARQLPIRDTVVEEIIETHLEELAARNFRPIARALDTTVDEVIEAARTINKCFNPTPGSGYGGGENRAIVPDVFIHKVGDEYVISLNEDGLPKLKVSPYYRDIMSAGGELPDQAKGYIQDKLKSAMWLIKSVHQRQRTIHKVVECIVKFQKEFLDHGLRHLKPLVLKDVAETIGMHESTVSRVTSNKYVQTPRGIFELKYFFSGAMSSTDGSDLTAEYIKQKIDEILKGEDERHPLSDQQIVEMLKEQGIVLARRTAAKYRESLGYLSSSKRKVRF